MGALLLNDRVVSGVIHVVMGVPQPPAGYWLAPLLGMLLWPPLHLLLDSLRLRRQ
jgi:rod shape-determining protein MreD